jgi:hypothetical protein
MIEYSEIKAGDKLRITGAGAPGFAKIGDVVTVTKCNGHNRLDVVNEAGDEAYFALTCGAARLEPAARAEPVTHEGPTPTTDGGR